MSLQPIFNAPPAVIIHFFTVVPAFFLGGWLLLVSVKGSRPHRAVGKLYMLLMISTSAAALFIRTAPASPHLDLGPQFRVGLIHLFIPLTIYGVYGGITCIRRGDVAGHRRSMTRLYFGALIIAGALAFTPGRIMHAVVFGS
jgi:uncharacterized membrane protein